MKVKSESEVTLYDPMDCSLPGSSAHGIFQARVLEWGAIAFSDSYPYSYPNPACKGLGFCLQGEELAPNCDGCSWQTEQKHNLLGFCLQGEELAPNCDGCSWQTEQKHSLLSLWVFLPCGFLHLFFT